MPAQQFAGRAALFRELYEGCGDAATGLFDGGDRNRGLSERKIVIERPLRRAAHIDNFVEAGARIALPPEQRDSRIDDRLPVLGTAGMCFSSILYRLVYISLSLSTLYGGRDECRIG